MRNQYKILAEKYSFIKEQPSKVKLRPWMIDAMQDSHPFVQQLFPGQPKERNDFYKYLQLLNAMFTYTGLKEEEMLLFIDWAKKYLPAYSGLDYNFLDEIVYVLTSTYAHVNGIFVGSPDWYEKASEGLMKDLYNRFTNYRAGKELEQASDKADIKLDI
jgi:hypothetical protein